MQPNIVFAFADDWGLYASAYRQIEGPNSLSQLINTPNFDRIANDPRIAESPCRFEHAPYAGPLPD